MNIQVTILGRFLFLGLFFLGVFCPVKADTLTPEGVNLTHVDCYGDTGGAITIDSVTGGTEPYNYSWSNGDTTQDISDLASGTYSLTITDSVNDTFINSYDIQEPLPLSVTKQINHVSCWGLEDGEIELQVNGGTSPYTYNWTSGDTSSLADSLSAGHYTVTVTDSNGCSLVDSFTVNQPDSLALSPQIQDALCYGDTNGSIDVTVDGGTSPYTYNWTSGDTSSLADSLSAGLYTVTVTDSNGCSLVDSFTVNQPDSLALSPQIQDALCYGDTSGSIDVTVDGGTAPYTYNWTSGDTSSLADSLSAGTYMVTVSDSNGCMIADGFTVGQLSEISVTATIDSVRCHGTSDGGIRLSVSGGNPEYEFLWNTGDHTDTLSDLEGGIYSVTVTDTNGCRDTSSYTVYEPDSLTLKDSIDHVSCFEGQDGSINVNVQGGNPSYTFNWSVNGFDTSYREDLTEGNYYVTVTDRKSCVIQDSFIIEEPPPLSLSAEVSDVNVHGGSGGSIELSVSGGTSGYDYVWSNGDTVQDLSYIEAGIYSVTVTDTHSCRIIDSFTVEEPIAPLYIENYQRKHVSCPGEKDGAIDIYPVGGAPPYTYNWSNGDTVAHLNGLGEGSYTITVTDTLNNETVESFSIEEPDSLQISDTLMNIECHGEDNGRVHINNISGGVPPYEYIWNTGDTVQQINALAPGNYQVTVTDDHDCRITKKYTIEEPKALQMNGKVVNTSCLECANGGIDVTVTGGRSPYSYEWNTGVTKEDLGGVGRDDYQLIVEDANGCNDSMDYTIRLKAPEIKECFPKNGDVGVEKDTMMWVIYDLNVDPVHLDNIQINNKEGQSVTDEMRIDFDSTKNKIIMEPLEGLSERMSYQVVIPAGTVVNVDSVGNDSLSWNFTTANTGINELYGDQLKVWPVPAKETIYIEGEEAFKQQRVRFVVESISGRTVFQRRQFFDGSTSIHLTSLKAGIYILKIIGEEAIFSKKLIIH